MSKAAAHFYEFGPFRIDIVNHVLLRDGEKVPLKPKAFDTLLLLVENRGRVLDKDELMSRLWPDTVVEEANLTQNIYLLRKVLGEVADGQSYIETMPKRGYRFLPSVREVEAESADVVLEEHKSQVIVDDERGEEVQAERKGGFLAALLHSHSGRLVAMAVTLIALATAVLYLWLSNGSRQIAPPTARTMAVLPFRSLGSDTGDDYLGLAMADTLITKLSGVKQIIVRPTTAVRKYTGSEQDALAAGGELKVDFVLEGSIQRSGDKVRVTLRLLNVNDGSAVWSYKGDESSLNVLALQDSISEQVARALIPKLTGDQRSLLAKHSTDNPEAHELYMKGRYLLISSAAAADVAKKYKAIESFNGAIKKDPDFALAYSALADTYMGLATDAPPTEAMPKAQEAALKAMALDDALAEPHISLGNVKAYYEWDWSGAEAEFKRAIDLNPNSDDAHRDYGQYLSAIGRFGEAIAEFKRSREIVDSPLSLGFVALAGARQYDQLIEEARKSLEIEPNQAYAQLWLGIAYAAKGMQEEAIVELQKAAGLSKGRTTIKALLGNAYASTGRRGEAERVLAELEELSRQRYVSPYDFALIYAGLGDKERAFAFLEKACQERAPALWALKFNPAWDSLRSDPRFTDLLRRIGLPQ